MKCKDFKRDVFLFISGELSKRRSDKIEKHLRNCAECSEFYKDAVETIGLVKDVELYAPSEYIKEQIFEFSANKNRKKEKSGFWQKADKFFAKFYFNPAFSYGGLAVILLLTFLSIIKFNLLPFNRNINLKWNDDFLMQITSIEQDVNNIENGEYNMALYDDLSLDSEESSSVFSDDFIDLRQKVIEMMINN